MTLEQIAGAVVAAVVGGVLVALFNKWRQWAQKGRLADEHENLVTIEDCERCRQNHQTDMLAGNEIFLLLLEGQALHTQALIHLCDNDEGCRELRAKLQNYLSELVTRNLAKRDGHG
jgi:hypothetical protein